MTMAGARRMKLGLIGLALASVLAAAPAMADSIDDQFKQVAEGSSLKDWRTVITAKGRMADRDVHALTARLEPGVYTVVGICDTDCKDVDLKAADAAGRLLSQDEEDDDMPVVKFTLAAAADITLTMYMADCREAPCGFAVRAYLK